MALSEFERERIEKLFGEYCQRKVSHHVRNMVRIEYKIRGSEVKLFECRPQYDDREEKNFEKLLVEVDRDTTGIFWG